MHFDDGSVKRVNAPARLVVDSYQPYGVECYCPPTYPPMAVSSIFLIGQICPDKTGREATSFVADSLKVTKWLDSAAEMVMGFLPCEDVEVLIKRYWMGQEVYLGGVVKRGFELFACFRKGWRVGFTRCCWGVKMIFEIKAATTFGRRDKVVR